MVTKIRNRALSTLFYNRFSHVAVAVVLIYLKMHMCHVCNLVSHF